MVQVLATLALLVGGLVATPVSSFAAEPMVVNDPVTATESPAMPEAPAIQDPGASAASATGDSGTPGASSYGRVAVEIAIGAVVVGGAFAVGFIAGEGLSSGLITAAAVGIIYSIMQ